MRPRKRDVLVFTPLKYLSGYLQDLIKSKLWIKVLIGMFLGILFGILMGPDTGFVREDISATVTSWTALPGNVFLKLVQMIMIPLVVSSIIQGIAGGDNADQLKKIGPGIGIYFVITTVVAIIIGISLALLINPGNYSGFEADKLATPDVDEMLSDYGDAVPFPLRITNLLPSNPLQAFLSGEMLSIVLFSIIIGIALINIESKTAQPLIGLFYTIQEVCMTVIKWAMKIAPFAVFGLIAQIIAKIGYSALTGLAVYVITVLVGLTILMLLYLTLIQFFTRISPGKFLRSTRDLLLLAFSVASSAAVMPLSMKTLEEKFKVNPSISRFIIPIGATVNMNGTALYQAVATIFIAQVYGFDLSLMNILLIVVTTVAASIGTPSSPGAGIVILGTVLSSVGIPIEGIAMIIGVDSFLGMSRAAVNVAGDLTATLIFDKLNSPATNLETASATTLQG